MSESLDRLRALMRDHAPSAPMEERVKALEEMMLDLMEAHEQLEALTERQIRALERQARRGFPIA